MSDTEDRRLLADALRKLGYDDRAIDKLGYRSTNLYNASLKAIAKARQQERERVVNDIRNGSDCYMPDVERLMLRLADRIERGDHIKGTSE